MIIEYVVLSLALKIIPVKNTKSFMKVLTVICGGVFELGNPKGRAGSSSFGNSGGSCGGGGSKNRAICQGEGVDFFWKNQFVWNVHT